MPLDIGVGILLSLGVAAWFDVPLTPLLVLVGVGAALLPDIDIANMVWGRWKHRVATHFPLTYVPLCALLFLTLPTPYATLITLAVFAHFVHDTVGIGWGIAWAWPCSRKKYLFFPGRRREPVMGRFASWLPEEQPALEEAIEKHSPYQGTGSWVLDYYARPTPLAFIEYGTLFIACTALILTIVD
jgi:LexA-binding, inner membrane-associated putative hydrolase